jgi:cytochrome b involved in lipid metabolism
MNKLLLGISILLLCATVILSGCVSNSDTNNKQITQTTNNTNNTLSNADKNIPVTSNNNSSNGKYNLAEIAKHNTAKDCWMAIDGKVYDLTEYIALGTHKPIIVQGCGIDATQMFNEKHDAETKKLLENYYLGELN